MPSLPVNRGAKRAREARAALGLSEDEPVGCILTVAEERAGLPAFVLEMPEEVAGAYWREGTHAFAYVNGRHATVRQRFTLAHELGHHVCRHAVTRAVDEVATLQGRTSDPLEIEANAFAAELLAPAAGVRGALARADAETLNLEAVVRLAAHFGISAIAALYRLRTLGILPAGGRYARLRSEIVDENLHLGIAAHLDLADRDDALARIGQQLPRLPAAARDSALGAMRRGEASLSAAAAAAGCDERQLSAALEDLRL